MSWEWADRTDNGKIQSSSTPITAAPVTFFCWFKHENDSDNDDCLFQIEDASASNQYFRYGLRDGTSRFLNHFTGSGSINESFTTTEITGSIWENYIGVNASSTSRVIYLNNGGDSAPDTNSNSPSNLDRMTIGREGDSSPSDSWSGLIAEVAVWDVAINSQHRAMLNAGFSPLMLTDILSNLVTYEPLNGPVLNRYQIHANAPTFTAGADSGTAPTYNQDHPRIIYPSAQILQFPPAAAPAGGRVMSSLANYGGLAGYGGIAGKGGGLAG